MNMRVFQNGNGVTVIDQDEEVLSRAVDVDTSATEWTYVNRSGETVKIDISSHRPNLDVLAGLYKKAAASKQAEDAAAYVSFKNRILAMFYQRDVLKNRYETGSGA